MRAGYPVYPAHNLQREQYSMKFGFTCPQVPGHLNPMTTLARHLQMRNHDVVFLYSSGAAGLPFIPDKEVERVISERSACRAVPSVRGNVSPRSEWQTSAMKGQTAQRWPRINK
jgi:hypothetical protein